jgi:UDP-3-O-[3-hydroxymyristoyl] glucosamine N-acyltransferase
VTITVSTIVASLGGELLGDGTLVIKGIQALAHAGGSDISFISHDRYRAQLASTHAGCLIVAQALAEQASQRGVCIVTPEPYLYYARLSQWWRVQHPVLSAVGHHPMAYVAPGAHIDDTAVLGPFVCVETGAVVEAGAQIGAHGFIGARARVGAGSLLHPRVTVHHGCEVGARVVLHSGVVIGADGFGFAPQQGEWVKIEQLGNVRVGDDCEIGANTCIDRGALGDTVLGRGVKLDNLIQIGHNVHIGDHTAMAGCAGVAGSAVIGARCTIGGGAVVLGHLSLADDVHISAASVVTKSVRKPGHYSGVFPLDDNASWEKNAATIKQLHQLRERLRHLENRKTL